LTVKITRKSQYVLIWLKQKRAFLNSERKKNEKTFYPYRAARGYRHHSHSCSYSAASIEQRP
jgi:hypothetical protein